jgi:hypothetical protein
LHHSPLLFFRFQDRNPAAHIDEIGAPDLAGKIQLVSVNHLRYIAMVPLGSKEQVVAAQAL